MKFRNFIVNCRIGSLEILMWKGYSQYQVNCRLGSLENKRI